MVKQRVCRLGLVVDVINEGELLYCLFSVSGCIDYVSVCNLSGAGLVVGVV